MTEPIDPWVRHWTKTGIGPCDGCGDPDTDVMRVLGGGRIAMCAGCQAAFMELWRVEDAESFRHEALGDWHAQFITDADFEAFCIATAPAPASQMRRAA